MHVNEMRLMQFLRCSNLMMFLLMSDDPAAAYPTFVLHEKMGSRDGFFCVAALRARNIHLIDK